MRICFTGNMGTGTSKNNRTVAYLLCQQNLLTFPILQKHHMPNESGLFLRSLSKITNLFHIVYIPSVYTII